MRGSRAWITVVVVIIIIVVAALLLTGHKSSKSNTSSGSSTTTSAEIVKTMTDSNGKQYLADSSGKPLYTYNADKQGVSNCTGSCISNWPIYSAQNAPATLPANVSVITRSDGSKQYAYSGLPLYTFTGDSSSSPTGNGVENFTLASPSASSSSPSSSTPSSSPSSSSTNSSSSSNGYSY